MNFPFSSLAEVARQDCVLYSECYKCYWRFHCISTLQADLQSKVQTQKEGKRAGGGILSRGKNLLRKNKGKQQRGD